MSLFSKKPKVKAGKAVAAPSGAAPKRQSPFAALSGGWKKLNSMDRKQAYTWGSVVLVAILALLLLGSAASNDTDDFSTFESRGYDLANMPFSTDEAEQYLLANKYPDMKDTQAFGLYSADEKAARQKTDEFEEEEMEENWTSGVRDSGHGGNARVGGSYHGGARVGGTGTRTNVGQLSSANLKGARGSGMSGTFGPRGDFSNFKSQDKGYDKAPGMNSGSSSARKALFQTAMGSRAAAGLKDNKLINAKKAMLGGHIDGSKAFLSDSGAVDLSQAKGLNLDTNAPVGGPDLSDLDKALENANEDASDDAQKQDEQDWVKEMMQRLAEQMLQMVAQKLINMGFGWVENKIDYLTDVHQMNAATNQEQLVAAYETYLKDGIYKAGGENGDTFEFKFVDKEGKKWETKDGAKLSQKEFNKQFKGAENYGALQDWNRSHSKTTVMGRQSNNRNHNNSNPCLGKASGTQVLAPWGGMVTCP